MENILEPQLTILKSKFFFYRIIGYFSFLFIPVYSQKYFLSTPWLKFVMMLFYLFFLVGQWFLIGKEVDYRLKIFFKVNSNMDRLLYRTIMGLVIFIMYANLINFLPNKWVNNIYWTTWGLVGLFFSWPTRGKIIKESVTSNFTEFKFLDSFEKTTLVLSLLMVFFSVPRIPGQANYILSLYDAHNYFDPVLWNFLKVSFYPFHIRPQVFSIGISMHFYFIFQCFFLLTFYALLRFFFSRRLSLLGLFAVVSSWGYSNIIYQNPGSTLSMIFPLIWIWSMIWVARSSSYKTGFFLGLINYFGVVIYSSYLFLIPLQIPLYIWVFFQNQTSWFRKQFFKYTLPGYFCTIITFYFHKTPPIILEKLSYLHLFLYHFREKAFLSISLLGVLIMIIHLLETKKYFKDFYFDRKKTLEILFFSLLFFLPGINNNKLDFLILCLMVFFSLIPLELLFQKTSKLRSARNIIFAIYVLICLLDSHFEGRVKTFLKIFT